MSLVLFSGCVQSHYNLATQTQDYSFTSTSKEVEMGRLIAQKVTDEMPLVVDEPVQQRLKTLGQRLVAVCDRKELVYQFAVVESEDVNAFSLPGGYVFIHSGLLTRASNDDELACVTAHEIAHITARHSVKRYESGLGLQLVQLATLATREMNALRGTSVALHVAQLAYARQDELEADRLAVKYMKAAGFDPKACLVFLEKLQHSDSEKPHFMPRGVVRPQYALTHPFVPERLVAVKEALYGVAEYIDYLNAPD